MMRSKIFTNEDQINFANISNDYNPIHVNPVISRRLIPGSQIVHGVNIFLTALNSTLGKKKFNKIKCNFFNPININEKVYFVKKKIGKNLLIEVKNKSVIFANIYLESDTNNLKKKEYNFKKNYFIKINKIKKKNINNNFSELKMLNRNYEINLSNFKLSKNYQNLKEIFSISQFKAILSISYFVGMVCPGLNSILSYFEINLKKNLILNKKINFYIENFDKRINLIKIKLHGTLEGEIKSFVHPGKTPQPEIRKIKQFVKNKEFLKTDSLIIGGSRGLGELTAKILACGKGKVNITYFKGFEDAKKLKKEISSTSGKKCEIKKLNIIKDDLKKKAKFFSKYDYIFFFATPKISIKKNDKFDKNVFNFFYKFYVQKFKNLCELLEKNSKKKQIIFFPSTIFIENTPSKLKEYAKAKLFAEKMINKLNIKFKKLRIVSERLPKLKTDQTTGVISNLKNQNIKIMIPIIRNIFLKKI